jgi:hypothetical protein
MISVLKDVSNSLMIKEVNSRPRWESQHTEEKFSKDIEIQKRENQMEMKNSTNQKHSRKKNINHRLD